MALTTSVVYNRPMKKLALILPIISGACWGCCGVFVRFLYQAGFDNITITFSRIAVTLLLFGAAILVCDKSLFHVTKHELPPIFLTGIVGYFVLNLCYNEAIHTLSLSLATILLCMAPIFVIIFGSILFSEKITVVRVVCMIAALLGCLLLSGIIESGALQWSLFGIIMGVCSTACNAVATMAMNDAADVKKCHPLTVQFYASLFAVIPMMFMADYSAICSFVVETPVTNILILLGNALIASLFPNLLFSIAFKYVDSGVVSILASGAEPVSALLFGLFVYQEVPTVFGLLGMIIVVTAMIILGKSDLKE